jgi:NSS family neurotransmitter:Na+ symporter
MSFNDSVDYHIDIDSEDVITSVFRYNKKHSMMELSDNHNSNDNFGLDDDDDDDCQEKSHEYNNKGVIRDDRLNQLQNIEQSTPTEIHQRQQWGSHISFLLASVGAAIGFGNFFRFPYLTYSNGGGAFLIPYCFALITMGIPLLLMELSIGQIMRRGPMMAMQLLNKRAGGIGLAASLFGSFLICSYYSVLLAWVLVYTFYTFRYELPWAQNSEDFFFYTILDKSHSMLDLSGTSIVSWSVLIALMLVWLIIYFCVWKGVKSTGFVAYITVPLPFILLTVILIRTLFLPGAFTGIVYYLKPDFSLLLNPSIWLAAAGQIFFSLGISSGVMTSFGSYNKPNQDLVRDNLIVCITNSSFSIFAGFAVFSVLGYMAHERNTTVDQVTSSGIGLAFVVFPDAVSLMPAAHLFALLLFATMFSLGIDSAFALVEATNVVIHDKYPHWSMSTVSIFVCVVGFCSGIPYTLTNGFYLMDAVDHYISDYCLPMIAIAECVIVGWCAASKSFERDFFERLSQFASQKPQEDSNENNRNPLVTVSWKDRTNIYLQTFFSHSIEEFRMKIKSVSRFGPFLFWSISIKFTIPVVLGCLWLIQFVNELTNGYSTSPESNTFDYGSLVLAIVIPLSCLLVILFFSIFPSQAQRQKAMVEETTIEHEHIEQETQSNDTI